MAARKRRRRRRNRGRFGVLYKLLSTLLILAAIVTGCIVFFRVDEIIVEGESRYTAAEIIDCLGVERGENLFQLDKFSMARQVRTQLPYIDEISISRKLPDTLVVRVKESTAIAVFEHGGSWWLLDARGKILEQGDSLLIQDRPVLLGINALAPAVGSPLAVEESQQQKLACLTSLLGALYDRGVSWRVSEFIDVSESRVRFGYNGTLTVEMPLYSDFSSQAWRLKRAMEELEAKNGSISGTLRLPAEGNQAWLLTERWMPGSDLPEASGEDQPEPTTQPDPAGASQTEPPAGE